MNHAQIERSGIVTRPLGSAPVALQRCLQKQKQDLDELHFLSD